MSPSTRMIAALFVVARSQYAIAQDSLFWSRERDTAVESSPYRRPESILTNIGYDTRREGGPEAGTTFYIYVHQAETA
ncbi:MAG: hypothetical protein KDB01_27245, partial [Planctomycetaceae bacterium]|nr:hypothetical protein [Planctomycetaceae bacterium]